MTKTTLPRRAAKRGRPPTKGKALVNALAMVRKGHTLKVAAAKHGVSIGLLCRARKAQDPHWQDGRARNPGRPKQK